MKDDVVNDLLRLKEIVAKTSDTKLELASSDTIVRLREIWPKLPLSYVELLMNIGAGTVGKMGFRIYGGPIEADDIFDPITAQSLRDYLFLGDDYFGWMIAYHMAAEPWKLVLFNHHEPMEIAQEDFAEFLCHELSR